MNSTANRLGNDPGPSPGFPHAGKDSIHGSAIVTPMPRRTVRLEMLICLPLFTGAGAPPGVPSAAAALGWRPRRELTLRPLGNARGWPQALLLTGAGAPPPARTDAPAAWQRTRLAAGAAYS